MKIPEILLVESEHKPGSLAKILKVIGDAGLVVEHLNMVRREQDKTIWEITLEMDVAGDYEVLRSIDELPNARILGRSDRVFNRHLGGKIRMVSRLPIATQQELRDIYTPGVARVCLAIQKDPELAWKYTNLGNTVAIITNGTAILGLGNIGSLAGMPVMEGKAALFARLVDITGIPILLDESDPERIIDIICSISRTFGAIQLEDIGSPECFAIEAALIERLNIPVLHDDQHGTAVVALAALIRATQKANRDLNDCVVGQVGLGAAGLGIGRLLKGYGVRKLIGSDRSEQALRRLEAIGGRPASLVDMMKESDIVIATTGVPDLIKPEMIRPGQFILALGNPDPEIQPLIALRHGAAFAADGGSVNNLLGFPGLFRGALDARAPRFTDEMMLAAARKLAELASGDELVPSALDRQVHAQVAAAVQEAALKGNPAQ